MTAPALLAVVAYVAPSTGQAIVGTYLLTHVVAAVLANYVSEENHLRPSLALLIGALLGLPGLYLVYRINKKRGADMKAEARAQTFEHQVHPMFGGPEAPPPEPPSPTLGAKQVSDPELRAANAFRVPNQAVKWRERDQADPGDGAP